MFFIGRLGWVVICIKNFIILICLCIPLSLISVNVYASDGIFDFRDTKTDGLVEVVKDWIGDKLASENPDIGISAQKPFKDKRGYTVTFNAGRGCFPDGSKTNNVVYSKSGKVLAGSYKIPNVEFGDYYKWEGNTVVSDDGSIEGDILSDITVDAVYTYLLKYAVTVDGIEDDVDINGNTLGLRFYGAYVKWYPKDDEKLKDVYTEHIGYTHDGTTDLGNAYRCINKDSWEEILKWNEKDPYVYSQCKRKCACTVYLDTKETQGIFDPDSYILQEYIEGDGISGLYASLFPDNRKWNYDSNSYASYSSSRLRAVLNGSTEDTLSENNASMFSKDNCIFSCLPGMLKESIVPSKKNYRITTGYRNETSRSDTWYTYYDNLFLSNTLNDNKCVRGMYSDVIGIDRFLTPDTRITFDRDDANYISCGAKGSDGLYSFITSGIDGICFGFVLK